MKRFFEFAVLSAVVLLACAARLPPAAAAPTSPVWRLSLAAAPTNFPAGADVGSGYPQYSFLATNIGGAPTSGPVTIVDTLPPGLTAVEPGIRSLFRRGLGVNPCDVTGQVVSCIEAESVQPGEWVQVEVPVEIDDRFADPSSVLNGVAISGGGAEGGSISLVTAISAIPPGFGFLPGAAGLGVAATAADGVPVAQAGAHPYQLTAELGLPTKLEAATLAGAGTLHDAKVVLPKGLVVDPGATSVRCSEIQLLRQDCPDASQVGLVYVPVNLVGAVLESAPLYNMAPPPGVPAELGFGLASVAFHILGGMRPADFRLFSDVPDILARVAISGAQVQLWGSPTDPSHDRVRGICETTAGVADVCAVAPRAIPFLTMPTSCSGSLRIDAEIDSWEEKGTFLHRAAELADANGDPVAVSGCGSLPFSPTLEARLTSGSADSPAGLAIDVHLSQEKDVSTLATAHLRKAVVTLPDGLVVNPAGANGLDGCDSSQVGIDPTSGIADGGDPRCPDASKLGTVEVRTPLLGRLLHGAVYLATPHDNPFGSLLAIYLVVDDARTGILVKLAGRVIADPETGRLTAMLDESPQLPLEDVEIDLFEGAASVLRTPATCGTYTTEAELTPWSAPESGPPAARSDAFAVAASPAGACPRDAADLTNAPSIGAGSVHPVAGAYTPFLLDLRRADGTQQLGGLGLRLPPGLGAKLAGVPACGEAALAALAASSGAGEKASSTCPAASRVGAVVAGAGAGPTPYFVGGDAYLTGPYKGAPLGLAFVVPAVAGPFDLGVIVVRAAVRVAPRSARLSIESDPFPAVLSGIPLDLRSVRLSLDRPDFVRNPTNCEPMSIEGAVGSIPGPAVPVSERFQVAGCGRLGFEPRLGLRFGGAIHRNGHPRLGVVLRARPGDASVRRATLLLPRGELLDQTHIGDVCARERFAAGDCPRAAAVGWARATTPLLDRPLRGRVYLRAGSGRLPDLAADLRGRFDLAVVARLDAARGRLRATFGGLPDVPVRRVELHLSGGREGLLVNSESLCAERALTRAGIVAYNGELRRFRMPSLPESSC